MKATSVVLVLGLALAPRAVRADDVPVTLAEAVALAEQANHELQAASARVDAQAAQTEAVRRLRRPRLGLSMDLSRTDRPAGVFASTLNAGRLTMEDLDVASLNDPAAVNHLGTSLTLEVPIDVFGKIGTLAAALAAERDAAAAGTRDAVQEVRQRVTEAYRQAETAGRAVSARERHAAAAGGLEEGREALRVIQERRQAGMATLTDELETETAALGAALQEIAAAAEVAIADAALRRAAGEI